MLTPEPEASRAFYGRLLGWTYIEMPGMGHRVQVEGRDIGGLFDLAGPHAPPGTQPLIGVMVKVESADAACAKVASLGGTAEPAFDIMDQGRMAVCFDPNGAEFDVWEPRKMPGTVVDGNLHGAPCWFETMTTDVARKGVLLRAVRVDSRGHGDPGIRVHEVSAGLRGRRRHFADQAQMGKLRPHWGVYFSVSDADEAARVAVTLGATLNVRVREVPNVGRFCSITSPQGVSFHVFPHLR